MASREKPKLARTERRDTGVPKGIPRGPQYEAATPPATESRSARAGYDGLTTNFFPAILSSDRVEVLAGKWHSPEAIDSLKAAHPGLSTWRDPDDSSRVYAWYAADVGGVAPTGFRPVTVSHAESPRLFQRLILDAVHTRLHALKFVEKGNGFVNYESRNHLGSVPALDGVVGKSIGIYAKVIVDGFFTKVSPAGSLVSGLIVDVLYTTRMDVTAAECVAAGIGDALQGLYVKLVESSPEGRRFPDLAGRAVGRIQGIRGDRCILDDPREPTLVDLPLSSVAPEPTRKNLEAYLLARHERAYEAGQASLVATLRRLVRPRTRHKYAEGLVLKRVQGDKPGEGDLSILPGVTLRFGQMERAASDIFSVTRLNTPEFSFDPTGEKFDRRVDSGLQRFGPYDAAQMERQAFRILVITPAEHKGETNVAVQKLLSGVSTNQNVFTGLKKMYRLGQLSVTQAVIEPRFGVTMKGYSEALRVALAEAPAFEKGEPKFHLVLNVIRAAHRNLPDSENPYYQMKGAALVREHIPTQAVFVEKLRESDYGLQYILNTMAVAIYAKLGGTSHVLKVAPMSKAGDARTELVFGIGRDERKDSRFGRGVETIGFATVFRANGEYLYNDCTPYCASNEYERALEETIRRTVQRVADFEQLEDGAKVRLVFHVPRRPGKREERSILNAVGKLPRFDIEFAIVHVNDDHHFQLFDTANASPRTKRGEPRPEAALLPARGWSVAIGPRERLVTFVGPDQYRGNGCPSPIRVTLDSRSTFTDIDYVTQQLFSLSFMSVRSLTPGVAPVTITYAKQLGLRPHE